MITSERTGGTSSVCASGNPPVVSFPSQVPDFKSNSEILSDLAASGYTGTDAPESWYVLEHVTYQHLMPYLKALDAIEGYEDIIIAMDDEPVKLLGVVFWNQAGKETD